MQNYDFTTLNPTDFEKLVCDLLNRKAESEKSIARFYSFKEGKDRGIDLLYATKKNDFEIVVQVKHFVNSSYSSLKSVLINSEKAKVERLKPTAYIFVTSQPLNYNYKKEIQGIFSPYIKSVNDILGRDDLNDLLRQNPNIVEMHFKLWFSSTVVLKKIMQYKYIGRVNEYMENILQRKLRLFVVTRELNKAEEILRYNKFLIITGNPGVGKTTLSDILVYKYISKGFELTVLHDSIYEMEDVIRDDDSMQLFYFDDFLGHTQAEIQKSKAAETSLIKQLMRIENSNNKFLILNTRKFILTTMLEESERFRNFKPLRGESKIVLESYSYGAKRKMLDNHLFESDIPDVLKEVVTDCAFKICDDNNFSPRYLEFFTSAIHVNSFTKVQFYNYIYESLRNPIDIWEHAYIQQISMYDRLLINTLYSLGGIEYYDKLEYVFNERLNFEAINNNYPRPFEPFKTSMKNLNGSFLDIILVNGTQRISFINPSLEDYLNNKIRGNLMEVQRILYSACFIEQWYHFFKPFKDKKESLPSEFFIFFRMNYEKFSKNYLTDNYLYCVSLFLHFFDSNEETLSLELFKKIKDWSLLSNLDFISSHFDFINSLKEHKHFKMLIGYLPSDFFYMTLNLVENIFEVESIIHVLRLYGFDFFAKLKSHNKKSLEYKKAIEVQKNYEELLQWEISFQYEQLMKNTEIDEHLDVIYKIETSCQILKKHINPKLKIEYDNIKNNDWNTIAANNSLDIEIFGEKINPEDYDIYVAQYEYDEYDEVYDYESESKQNYNIDIFNVQESEEEGNDLPF